MKFRNTIIFLIAATVASAAFAGDELKKDKNDPSRLICRRETSTGSIMGTKVCHTAAEWEAIREKVSKGGAGAPNRDTRVKPGVS